VLPQGLSLLALNCAEIVLSDNQIAFLKKPL